MATLGAYGKKHKVTVVGSGNWYTRACLHRHLQLLTGFCRGSAIAKIVAENAKEHPDLFEEEVQMWVYEEETTVPKTSKHYDSASKFSTQPHKLTKLINHFHEN
ncbi:MAG: hypothetical protein Q9224_005791, partial [Gallowayella concinna]